MELQSLALSHARLYHIWIYSNVSDIYFRMCDVYILFNKSFLYSKSYFLLLCWFHWQTESVVSIIHSSRLKNIHLYLCYGLTMGKVPWVPLARLRDLLWAKRCLQSWHKLRLTVWVAELHFYHCQENSILHSCCTSVGPWKEPCGSEPPQLKPNSEPAMLTLHECEWEINACYYMYLSENSPEKQCLCVNKDLL